MPFRGSDIAIATGGRLTLDSPVDYQQALKVCERIAIGKNINEIEREAGMPPLDLFFAWATRDQMVRKAFIAAREMSSFAQEEDALWKAKQFLDKDGKTATDARALEIFLTQTRWSIENRNPNAFGNKAKVSLTIPIQINTTLDMGGEQQGTKDHPKIYNITPPTERTAIDIPDVDEVPQPVARAPKPRLTADRPKYKDPVKEAQRQAKLARTREMRSKMMKELNARKRAEKEAPVVSDNP